MQSSKTNWKKPDRTAAPSCFTRGPRPGGINPVKEPKPHYSLICRCGWQDQRAMNRADATSPHTCPKCHRGDITAVLIRY